tara:strand:+ start:811 stop:1593 length:783 start_codon:yes stop_codon:yes gene_type:complete
MKKLLKYIFLLIMIIASVRVFGDLSEIIREYNQIKLEKESDSPSYKSYKMLEPVVKLTTVYFGPEGAFPYGSATGFSINYDSKSNSSTIITNAHFCSLLEELPVGSFLIAQDYKNVSNGVFDNAIPAEIISYDEQLDLCALEVNGFVRPAELAPDYLRVVEFEELFIVGAPSGNFPIIIKTYSSGYVERKSGVLSPMSEEGEDILFVSEIVFPGHSGSPIFNREGQVVALVYASTSAYGALCITIRDLEKFLNEIPSISF